MKRRILICLYIFFPGIHPIGFAQNRVKIDSLQAALRTAKEDTSKVKLLNDLGKEWIDYNPDTSLLLGTQALMLAEKKQWKGGIAESYRLLGVYHKRKGDHAPALENFKKALLLFTEVKDKKGMSKTLSYIGNIYHSEGDFPKALNCHLEALGLVIELNNKTDIGTKLSNIAVVYYSQNDYLEALEYNFRALRVLEEAGEKKVMDGVLSNIGVIYMELRNYPKALEFHAKALKMAEEIDDKKIIAGTLSNIGSVYDEQGDYTRALDCFFKALKINEETGNKEWEAVNLGNIGGIIMTDGDSALVHGRKVYAKERYMKAMDYYFRALKINTELDEKQSMGLMLASMGALYTKLGKYKEAEDYLKKGKALTESLNVWYDLQGAEVSLATLYETTGRYKEALGHYKIATEIRDSLYNQEKKDEITRKGMLYEFKKKEDLANAEQDKKDVLAQQQIQKQKILKYGFIGGFGMVIVLLLFGYRFYRTQQLLRLQDIRNKIAGDLHDDIGSTLNSISIYSEVARKRDSQQDEALEMIGEASRKIIDAMSDIVWTVNPENDSFAKIIFRMKSFAYNLLRAKKIEFTFYADEILDEKKLSLEIRRNFYLIFKEAINNLVKYSNATRTDITLTNEINGIRLRIRDDGVGFDMTEDTNGNGLKNIRRRAAEMKAEFKMESSKGNGTQLELILKA